MGINFFSISLTSFTLGMCATLTWSRRMKVALDAARGLAFLHEADMPVIYRDLKTSNILLDAVRCCFTDVYSFP